MTRFFTKIIAVTWLIIAIVAVARTATLDSARAGPTAETVQQTPKASASLKKAVKAKNEVLPDCRLQAPGKTSPPVANSERLKAQSDGQNVLTLLVERLTAAISKVL